jgi:hypothetical protein
MRKGFSEGLSGGERAPHALLSELIDGVGVAIAIHDASIHHIHNKQIACTVKGQTFCAVRHGAKGYATLPT